MRRPAAERREPGTEAPRPRKSLEPLPSRPLVAPPTEKKRPAKKPAEPKTTVHKPVAKPSARKPVEPKTTIAKPVAKPPERKPSERKPRGGRPPAPKLTERTMFPGPKPGKAGERTEVYRPWRNEPTVLIPVVGDDDEPPPRPDTPAPATRLQQKRERKDHRALFIGKISLAVAAVLVFLAAGGAWGMKVWYNSKFTEVVALDEQSKDIKHSAAQLGDENFLILGSDTRAGAPKGAGIGTEKTIKGARSDTLMIAHLPKDRSRAILVSFPRDLEVTRPECKRWNYKTGKYSDELMPETPQVKLNTAYAEGGPQCVTKLIQKMTGMRMNHFVGIDFSGFKGMVDAVGGVEVDVDMPIEDSILGTVVEKAGKTTLTGDRALSFVRARHVAGDPTSDYGRIKRQQQFIAALLGKTMSQEVLLSPSKLTGFVNAFAASTFGDNIDVDQLLTLAQSMKGMSSKTVKFLTVPTTGYANELGNEVLLEEQAAEVFAALIHSKPVPGIDDVDPKDGKDKKSDKEGSGGSQEETETAAQDAENP